MVRVCWALHLIIILVTVQELTSCMEVNCLSENFIVYYYKGKIDTTIVCEAMVYYQLCIIFF